MKQPIFLGVNVDHVATVREARGERYPDPVLAALEAEQHGADSITMHLREDRRHVQDHDIARYSDALQTKLNLEMAATEEMCRIALATKPRDVCLVPEKREELTTEGGLDVIGQQNALTEYLAPLAAAGIQVSLFIDPDEAQIETAARVGAPVVELHTGAYAEATNGKAPAEKARDELERIRRAADLAYSLGLVVNAGHGLNYHNVQPIAEIETLHELNIGHGIVARALFSGFPKAVSEMKRLMREARYR
ncbi:MAG: pyridoxine 5'-phosphate synthase [Gammaproteobacteria bacterium]|nr:MAG: pyridoxine 5'-phosphate synthase [Gammaproteobacteria bacterium]